MVKQTNLIELHKLSFSIHNLRYSPGTKGLPVNISTFNPIDDMFLSRLASKDT